MATREGVSVFTILAFLHLELMLFVFSNGMSLFVPAIFPSEETLNGWPVFKLFYALELLSIFATFPGAALLVHALGKSLQLFHKNLIRVAQVHLVALTISGASRVFIFLYDINFVNRSSSFDALLFILFVVRFICLCSLMTLIPAVITERSFASRYINDYESTTRPWISSLVNISSLVLSTIYYVLVVLGKALFYVQQVIRQDFMSGNFFSYHVWKVTN
ncbi:hypothetical protein Y032_0323g2509 [Ancylostoma ceylanicum]|uniref:G-protein coupled receptors family 1 profile domain-containing protein n=2 Tax=Ancylostoma ceylanicum TaxID=53326 RepID=A0A016S1K5_9BILA|nr:hypothetical protein Y032_0323g2509 [Ancylostoma ceylanicum]